MPFPHDAVAVPPPTRLWRFGGAEFDEGRRELRVAGQRQAMEAKPLDLLQALLMRAGEVARKDDLVAEVWPDVTVGDGSLTTAISKLRAALGADGQKIIEAVPKIGYRIGVPIELLGATEAEKLAFSLRAGDTVPNRPQWRLERELGRPGANHVWLARHGKTGEPRVFKFADTGGRLQSLRREAAISRILHQRLGDRPDFVRVVEWSFRTRPWFIESAYGGPDLVAWATSRGGISAVALGERLGIVAAVARTLAAAHDLGVLHRDIKPANILVGDDTRRDVRLVDFGAGRITEAARVDGVSLSGLEPAADGSDTRGTLRYMAPEIVAGGPPTIAADVYSLGVLLFQMAAGDLGRPLAIGWEAEIADPLLREDIAATAAGDASQRLVSAALLADRLDRLQDRRAERLAQDRQRALAVNALAKLARLRQRRTWVRLAAACLVLGLIGTSVAAFEAVRARNEVVRQAAITDAINQFLTEDLLGRGNPAISGNPKETLMEAAEAAEPMIEQRLARQPRLAASIYLTLTKAFDGRKAFDASRKAYDRAEAILTKLEGAASADVTILLLRRAGMEATSIQPGSLEKSRSLIARGAPLVDRLAGSDRLEARAWLLWANGQMQIIAGGLEEAKTDYAEAVKIAETMPQRFDPQVIFNMRDQEGFVMMKLGEMRSATAVFSRLADEQTALHGPLHPNTLLAQLNLATIPSLDGDPALAIKRLATVYPAIQAVYGPSNRQTLMALSVRVQSFMTLGQYDAAERDAMELHRQAAATLGKTSFYASSGLGMVGESECRAGHVEAGLTKLREMYEISRGTLGEAHPVTQSVRITMAMCHARGDQPAEAEPLLNGFDCKAQGGMVGNPDLCAEIDLIRAQIAAARHDLSAARRLAQTASSHFAPSRNDPFFNRWAETLLASLPAEPSANAPR